MGDGDLNSGPYTCKARNLSTEPLSKSPLCVFYEESHTTAHSFLDHLVMENLGKGFAYLDTEFIQKKRHLGSFNP